MFTSSKHGLSLGLDDDTRGLGSTVILLIVTPEKSWDKISDLNVSETEDVLLYT